MDTTYAAASAAASGGVRLPHSLASAATFLRSPSSTRRHRPHFRHHRFHSITASLDPNGGDAAARRRREVLLLAAAAAANPAISAPVQPPDLRRCETPIDPGNGAAPVNCCLPVSTTITDFRLPSGLPLRTRPAAHTVTSDYAAKYAKAVELLRQLPSTDPRAWSQQANVHCAFCDAAYDENGTSIEYQVHNSWLFFPWHRWYLYFHERILATLINDNSFAIPFWNWDGASAAAAAIPPIYASSSQSSLYDANRNPAHLPPTVANLNYNFTESNISAAAQIAANTTIMYRQVVTNSKTPSLFFGQAYRQGGAASPGGGTVENVPHGSVHVWTGNPANPNDEDMGTLYSASRDPIFFAHHANIDRLWEVWKSLGGRRTDISDTDYLNATFLFYDENAKLVRVRVGDALDTTKLAYRYEAVPNAWLSAAPSRLSTLVSSAGSGGAPPAVAAGPGGAPPAAMAGKIRDKIKAELKEFKDRAEKKLEKIVSSLVRRPKKVKAEDYEEEILVIEGVEVPLDEKVKFDVYINLPEANEATGCELSEYAGSFVNVPRLGHKMSDDGGESTKKKKKRAKIRKSNFRLGIGGVLKELGIEDDESFSVTIVQRSDTSFPVSVDNIRLEYE